MTNVGPWCESDEAQARLNTSYNSRMPPKMANNLIDLEVCENEGEPEGTNRRVHFSSRVSTAISSPATVAHTRCRRRRAQRCRRVRRQWQVPRARRMSIRLAVLQRTNSDIVTCNMCRCDEVLRHLPAQDLPNCQALASREIWLRPISGAYLHQRMENKAAENVQQEAPIIDSGKNEVTSVENLPPPGLNSSKSRRVATIYDFWDKPQRPLQAAMHDQQLMQQPQGRLQVSMHEQQLEQQPQGWQQEPLLRQLLVLPPLQEPMKANGDQQVSVKKRKRGCQDIPPRDDEEAGPPNRRRAVGEDVPVYVPPGAASVADSLASAGALASPRHQPLVRQTVINFGGLKLIPIDLDVDPAPKRHFRPVYPSAKERSERHRVDYEDYLRRRLDPRRNVQKAGASSRLDSEPQRQEVQRREPPLNSVRGQRVSEQRPDEARNPASGVEAEAQVDDARATLLDILTRLNNLAVDMRIAATRIAALRSLFH
ncbi:unnamed protein product [Trichogramma brassicae]|uniref:Uncharacterized protein n=1 Tax=Trichogramma brassicae TaxID=86971 RepID=A0A6H5III6_9HYME|nr:unnamed protein product [Trichogramma brassicae]